jgi:murein DD-endopeptidase MepM/ murein hydrolase activator NlpD
MIRKILNLKIFKFIHGRQALSLWASKIFEKTSIKNILGINLVAAIFLTGVVSPQVGNIFNQLTVEAKSPTTIIEAEAETKTTIDSPLADFKVSQFFSFWHPGIDMVAQEGTPIYAIDDGVVEYAGNMFFGYGKHVIISHAHGLKSLYGHMSEIKTVVGKTIQRGELIGKVGSTGWSTGDHLHLEIYQNNVPQNPLEILPIKTSEVKLDGAITQSSTPSAMPN